MGLFTTTCPIFLIGIDHISVFGLQSAFKLAGAKALLPVLWQIPDQQTVELMELFYPHFLADKENTEALLLAMRAMRQNTLYFIERLLYW